MRHFHDVFAYLSSYEGNIIHIYSRHHLVYKLNFLKRSGWGASDFWLCLTRTVSIVTPGYLLAESAPKNIQADWSFRAHWGSSRQLYSLAAWEGHSSSSEDY